MNLQDILDRTFPKKDSSQFTPLNNFLTSSNSYTGACVLKPHTYSCPHRFGENVVIQEISNHIIQIIESTFVLLKVLIPIMQSWYILAGRESQKSKSIDLNEDNVSLVLKLYLFKSNENNQNVEENTTNYL